MHLAQVEPSGAPQQGDAARGVTPRLLPLGSRTHTVSAPPPLSRIDKLPACLTKSRQYPKTLDFRCGLPRAQHLRSIQKPVPVAVFPSLLEPKFRPRGFFFKRRAEDCRDYRLPGVRREFLRAAAGEAVDSSISLMDGERNARA
jgi:hypothetical protein